MGMDMGMMGTQPSMSQVSGMTGNMAPPQQSQFFGQF